MQHKYYYNEIAKRLNRCSKSSLEDFFEMHSYEELQIINEKSVNSYQMKYKTIPGYMDNIQTIFLMNNYSNDNYKNQISGKDLIFINEQINASIIQTLNDRNSDLSVINMMFHPQKFWQESAFTYYYLVYKFFEDPVLSNYFTRYNGINIYMVIVNIFIIRFLSFVPYEKGKELVNRFSVIYKQMELIKIKKQDFVCKQKAIFEKNDFDFVFSRLLIKDYPIVEIDGNAFITSFWNIIPAIFEKTIRKIGKENSKIIGNRFENVFAEMFEKEYEFAHKIERQPQLKKGVELCDILLQQDECFLFVDIKSKSFIEDINFNNDNSFKEKERLKDYILERYKKIDSIKSNKMPYFKNNSVNIHNIFSLIVVQNTMDIDNKYIYSNILAANESIDIDYCQSHIAIISHEDLTNMLLRKVNIIEHFMNRVKNGKYNNYFMEGLTSDLDSSNYEKWYNNISDQAIKIVKKIITNNE